MTMFKINHFLMNEVTEHGGEGVGGQSMPNVTDATQESGQSILAKAANQPEANNQPEAQPEQAQQPEQQQDWLQDKFKVLNADGTINYELSSQKMAGSYNELARRLGTGDIPPKSAEEYKVDLGENVNFDDLKKDPDTKEFLEGAQKAGLTNKQVEFVLQKYVQALPKAVGAFNKHTIESAEAELKSVWQIEQDYKANLSNAQLAFNKYASPDDKAKIDEIGNNPLVIRLLANIGKTLQEDQPASKPQGVQQADVKKLMMGEAYRNPNHPDHKAVHAQVQQYYQATYGNTIIS